MLRWCRLLRVLPQVSYIPPPALGGLSSSSSSSSSSSLHTTPHLWCHMELRAVVAALEAIAPTKAAESWDNVGLLLEPSHSKRPHIIKRVLITNDLTEPVLEEACEGFGGRAGMIVSYHPPIFKPFKSLTQQNAKERIIVRALEEGVAVYSPHTALDNMEGGINDWLLAAVGEGEVVSLGVRQHVTPATLLALTGAEDWQLLERECLSRQSGMGEVHVSTSGVTVECNDAALASLLPTLKRRYPTLSISLTPTQKIVPTLCGGKRLTLSEPIKLMEAVRRVKKRLKLTGVRLARPMAAASGAGRGENPLIATVAACAGSGGGVLHGGQADLLLTGEMSHHQVLEAVSRGSAVILCEHSNTERGFLRGSYREMLKEAFQGKIKVSIADADRDPLEIIVD